MKKLLFMLLRYLGLAKLFRYLKQKDKITILLFHDIDAKTAEQTFKYLSERYNIIDLDTYIEAHQKKDPAQIPKNALIITFDDGHIGNYEMLDAVKKYKVPLTIFLCTSIINTHRHFWFMYDKRSISKAELKQKSNQQRLKLLAKDGFFQEKRFKQAQALNKEQIDKMSSIINMQAHTMFHPILPRCNNEEARQEIIQSKTMLEKKYGFKINTIAYPNGDYCDRDIKIAKEAGYTCGITVDYGFNDLNTDLFKLKRFSVNDTKDINELAVKSSGLWAFLKSKKEYA